MQLYKRLLLSGKLKEDITQLTERPCYRYAGQVSTAIQARTWMHSIVICSACGRSSKNIVNFK